MGIETALPAARSAIQMVSPAGSTAVGVLRPSLRMVTLALSPVMVRMEILPLPFSATRSLPLAARMPSGPLTGWSIQMSTGVWGLPVGVDGDAVELVEDDVVDVEDAVEEGDAVYAHEDAVLEEEFGGGGSGGEFVDSAGCGVGDVEGLVGAEGEVVAGGVVAGEVPAELGCAGGEVEASEGGVALGWGGVGDGGELAGP